MEARWENYTLKRGGKIINYSMRGIYKNVNEQDEVYLCNNDMEINEGDELEKVGAQYIIKKVEYRPDDCVLCKIKQKEHNTVNITKVEGNNNVVVNGNNNYVSNKGEYFFDKNKFVKEFKKYLIDKDINFAQMSAIEEDMEDLSNELEKVNDGKESKIESVIKRIKEKATDIPFDMIKDGMESVIKTIMMNPALWANISAYIQTTIK